MEQSIFSLTNQNFGTDTCNTTCQQTPIIAALSSHRHQSSLEGLIEFSIAEPLFANEQQRTQAVGRFLRIVNYFEAVEQQASSYDG